MKKKKRERKVENCTKLVTSLHIYTWFFKKNIAVKQHILLGKLLTESQSNDDSSFKSHFCDLTAAFVVLFYHLDFLPPTWNIALAVYQGSKIQNHKWWLSSTWYHDPWAMLLPHAGSTLSLVVSFLLWHSSVYINPALSAPSPVHLTLCPCALFPHSMADKLPGLFQNLCWLMPLWVCLCLYLECPSWHTSFPLWLLHLGAVASVKPSVAPLGWPRQSIPCDPWLRKLQSEHLSSHWLPLSVGKPCC